MESFILNTIALTCLFICLTEAQTDLSLRLQSAESARGAALNSALHHKTTKRQTTDSTPSPEDEVYCQSLIGSVLCSTGVEQGLVDADLSCGGISWASIVDRCPRSENGEFCSSAFILFDLGGIGRRNIEGNCSEVIQSNSCPSACRTSLETFKSKLGCCINTYVNGTRYSSGSSAVDYHVWQLCGVTLPAADCGNSLDITPPATVDSCSPREIFERRYTQNFCLPSRGQPYVNALLGNMPRCSQYRHSLFGDADTAIFLCSMSADGFPCGLFDEIVDLDVESLDLACAGSNITCTSECRESLENVTKDYGCCINVFNRTSFGPPPSLSYDVWRSCGVETPGVCESTLSLNNATPNDTSSRNGAVSTVKGGFSVSWMIVSFSLMIILNYCCRVVVNYSSVLV